MIQKLTILISTFFVLSCTATKEPTNIEFEPMYVSAEGGVIWFQNAGKPDMVVCSGHTCIDLGQTFCDDKYYYCLNSPSLQLKIPKNLQKYLPKVVTQDFGTENTWSDRKNRYEVVPFGSGRVIYSHSKYLSSINILGKSYSAYLILVFDLEEEKYTDSILYSPKRGVIAISVDNEKQSFWLQGNCGYLANLSCK
ncbi:hypothetical protein GCM10009123_20460 [Kangiella japonica]|uniref:Lipoprotein n=1 Tax=Kangiella japonica TaxID=647384 RepID=A0ABN0T5D3_9GAMM